jgi:hypothetical protein
MEIFFVSTIKEKEEVNSMIGDPVECNLLANYGKCDTRRDGHRCPCGISPKTTVLGCAGRIKVSDVISKPYSCRLLKRKFIFLGMPKFNGAIGIA